MTLTKEQIDWIVAEVIRRLNVVDLPTSSDLKITERVVTLRTIERRLAEVKRVVVPRRAIVTPAVRDELKSKKIELVFET